MVLASGVETKLGFGLQGGQASVHLNKGEELTVKVETNPSTGYDWHMSNPLPECISLKSTAFEQKTKSERPLMGAPSIKVLKFTATDVCSGVINLKYNRPWDELDDSTASITIHVSVSENEL